MERVFSASASASYDARRTNVVYQCEEWRERRPGLLFEGEGGVQGVWWLGERGEVG